MGFLDFFRNNNRQDYQLALFEGEETSIIDSTEPSRNLANKRLMEEAKKRGGTARTYPAINASAIQEMLGESPDQLYDSLGIPQSDRSRLPQAAKEALMVDDIAALEQILDNNAIGHRPLIQSATEGYRKAKGIFRWNR